MTELRQLTRPEMRSAASFEADKARRNIGEETQHLASSKLSSEDRPAIGVDAMNLEPAFRRIESDRCNRHCATPCWNVDSSSRCGDRPSHYFRFPLSLRMVEEMLAARGICVTYETVRRWGKKFGKAFSDQLRQRAPARGDKWHLDEVVVSIAGEPHWLWRAVDQNGFVLDVLIQRRRDSRAAQRLMRRLLKSAVTPPRVMVTDKLRSYGAARAKMGLRVEHRQHKGLNNRAENSHQPTRRRERIMKRFKSTRQAQRFLAIHDQVANLFHIPYPESATADFRRASRERAFAAWREISKTGATA
jgi:putative transposase